MAQFTIPTVFTAIDKITQVSSKIEKSMIGHANRIEAKYEKVGKNAQNIATNAGIFGAAVLAPLGLAANEAVKFQESMANVSTLIDTTTESMDQMNADVLKLSTTLPVPIEELTASLYDIRSAGIAAEDSMSVLEQSAKLSKAGLSTAAEATNVMTSAMNAFASEGKTANQVADILFKTVKSGKTDLSQIAQAFGATAPVVQSAGVSLADFSAATAALTTLGTPASQAQNQIRAAIVALQKPTADMEKVFGRLGVTTEKELIEKFGGVGGAFEAVNKAGKDMGINMSKAWSSVEAASAVTSLLGATNEAYTKTLADMTKGSSAVEDAFNKRAETGAAQMQMFKNNMQALSITVGNELLPVMNSLIKKISPIIQQVIGWAQANKDLVKIIVLGTAAIGALALVISGAAFVVVAFSKAMLVYSSIVKGVKIVLAAFNTVLTAFNAILTANPIGVIIAAIVVLIGVIALAIAKYEKWGAAVLMFLGPLGLVINMIQSFRRNWDMITNAFKTDGIIGGLKAIGITLIDAVLMPLHQLLNLASKIPGLGGLASKGADAIAKLRERMGTLDANATVMQKVEQTTTKPNNPIQNSVQTKLIEQFTQREKMIPGGRQVGFIQKNRQDQQRARTLNPELSRQEFVSRSIEERTSQKNLTIDINDNSNGKASYRTDDDEIPIKLNSTHGYTD